MSLLMIYLEFLRQVSAGVLTVYYSRAGAVLFVKEFVQVVEFIT